MSRLIPLLLTACLCVGTAHAQSGLFVITSDFATGSIAAMAPGAAAADVNLLAIHADAVGRYHGGLVYVVSRRLGDNIIVVDPAAPRAPLMQYSVGNGTNPQDFVMVDEVRAYIPRYDSEELLIVTAADGEQLGTVDLTPLADADGKAEMARAVVVGGHAFVACQRLDRDAGFVPTDVSYLAVIDTDTDALVDVDPATAGVQGVRLAATNPISVEAVGKRIIVGVVAGYGDLEGGIDVIDPVSMRSLGLALTEADLGGDLSNLAMVDADHGWAVVLDASFANHVRSVNLATGVVGDPLEGLSGGFIATLAVDGERLIIGDRGSFDDPTAAGLKIYDARSGAFLAGPIDTGLPPSDIVVLREREPITAVTETTGGAVPQDSRLDPAYPNPFNASVWIPFDVARAGDVELVVFDALGRRVRTLHAGPLAAGAYGSRWDGRDEAGLAVGNGAYVVRLRAGDQRSVSKVMLLK